MERASGRSSRRITLPLLRPVILVLLLLRIMDAFKVFDIVFTMTYGGPGQTTELLSMLIYKTGLRFFQIGQASAMSWVFLVGIFLISLVFHPEAAARRMSARMRGGEMALPPETFPLATARIDGVALCPNVSLSW